MLLMHSVNCDLIATCYQFATNVLQMRSENIAIEFGICNNMLFARHELAINMLSLCCGALNAFINILLV